MSTPKYEVYAIKYAESVRKTSEYFLSSDPHDGHRHIFYYIYVLKNADRAIVVDTGFDAQRAVRRQRDFIRCPTDGLRTLRIDPDTVTTVIVTHLHYDHAGNLDKFPAARFILQNEEMRYATGQEMRFKRLNAPFELSDVLSMVTHNYAGRVRFVSGVEEIAPGVVVHHVPGHTRGLQAVTVETARGRLCLASDAAHFYANITQENPFPIIVDVGATLEGHEHVLSLADSPDHLIPGHDPIIMDLYPQHPDDPLICDLGQAPAAPTPLNPDRISDRQ